MPPVAVPPAARQQPAPRVAAPPSNDLGRQHCLAPDEVADGDGDFARNQAALALPGFCIAELRFSEGRRPWTIQREVALRQPRADLVLPHLQGTERPCHVGGWAPLAAVVP